MELIEIIERLKFRLDQYKETENYKNYQLNRQNVRMVEIAILLTEMGHDNKREILKNEFHWFEGCYIISYDFGGEWTDISDLYCKMVDLIILASYFKS
jgi:hypothetical protein